MRVGNGLGFGLVLSFSVNMEKCPKAIKIALLAAAAFLIIGAVTGNPYVFTAGIILGAGGLLAGIVWKIYDIYQNE